MTSARSVLVMIMAAEASDYVMAAGNLLSPATPQTTHIRAQGQNAFVFAGIS